VIFTERDSLLEIKLLLLSFGVSTPLENLSRTSGRVSSCNGIWLDLEDRTGKKERVKVSMKSNPPSRYNLVSTGCNDSYKIIVGAGRLDIELPVKVGIPQRIPLDSMFMYELSGMLAVSLWGCELKNENQQCSFCSSAPYTGPKATVTEFKQELDTVLSIVNTRAITVNAGSRVSQTDKGFSQMFPYIEVLRDSGFNEVNVELMPPDTEDNIQLYQQGKDAGITSLQLNMEIWGSRRQELMPYKSRITKQQYLDAIQTATSVFGVGKVSSVLLAGLQNTEELREGAEAIISVGGMPSIEVFRALPGTQMKSYNPQIDYQAVISLAKEVKQQLQKLYGSNVFDSLEGCMRCGGCNFLYGLRDK
jgi:hypothetical protein